MKTFGMMTFILTLHFELYPVALIIGGVLFLHGVAEFIEESTEAHKEPKEK